MIKQGIRLVFFASLLLIWEIAGKKGFINKYLLPSPSTIMNSEFFKDTKIFMHVASSLQRVVVGYSISIVAGISLGFFIGLNKKIRYFLMPLFSILRPIPPIAWIPIAILWFGIGNGPSYFITMVASFFPIFFNTLSGIEDMDNQYLNVAECLGAKKIQIFKEVIFPYTLPFIFSGLRIGLGVAWMSVIAAEIVSASSGLGYVIEIAQQMVRVDNVIVGMIAIGICGIILDQIIFKIGLRLTEWKND